MGEEILQFFIENIVFFVIGAVVLIVVWVSLLITRCPKCQKWFAKKNEGRKQIGESREGYTYVTRIDTHKDKNGNVTGSTSRQEQVRYVETTYENFYHCKFCGHKWSLITTSRQGGY